MRTFDFSPLYRNTVGFDHLSSLLDAVNQREQNTPAYPPYNIETVGEDQYRISMAVAGFVQDELEIQVEKNTLTVKATKADDKVEHNYLYQGIAARNFERRFQLADHIKVTNARLENGLLHVDLVKEIPEAMKPRTIQIQTANRRLIDVDAAKAA
ncbi:MAG: Hsp20 family protein [Pseudohongiellaceae bacterium]